ncbi:NAD(P)-dependent alcohol dehydrogenase [Vibrio splendidus]
MEACIYREFGKEGVLEWVDNWPEPDCDPNSVIIKVAGSSINPKDALLRKGEFSKTLARESLPRLTGVDVSGTIVKVGYSVTHFKVGDFVYGMSNHFSGGVLSTFTELYETEIAKAPASIPLVEASAIPLAGQTALQAIRDIAHVGIGEKILITGASGGVGHFAVQLSKLFGAEVHALCSNNSVEFVSSIGASYVHDYTKMDPSTIQHQYDVIFDAAGRFKRNTFLKQLRKKSIFITTVPTRQSLISEFLARLKISDKSRLVIVKSSFKDLTYLTDLVDSGDLSPHIYKIYEKAKIVEAHTQIQSGHSRGKIVLSMLPNRNDK